MAKYILGQLKRYQIYLHLYLIYRWIYDIDPYVVLIEGTPGIDKTVLAKEIAFQWS